MTEALKIETLEENDMLIIQMSGVIDEEFQSLELDDSFETYIFDFQEVVLINSCGVREWILFIEKITKKIIYRNCPQIIIHQINMVKGFLTDNCEIESFYAPYYCEECDLEIEKFLKPSDITDQKAPNYNCDSCSEEETELEFDAIESQYFNFIKKT